MDDEALQLLRDAANRARSSDDPDKRLLAVGVMILMDETRSYQQEVRALLGMARAIDARTR
jgi:hypothetical protein